MSNAIRNDDPHHRYAELDCMYWRQASVTGSK
jgi:hypothetical protein